MFVVALGRHQRVGKDTVADLLVREHGYRKYAFADRVREGMLAIDPWIRLDAEGGLEPPRFERLSEIVGRLGWDKAKMVSSVREFHQRYPTEGCRAVFGDECWIYALERRITADALMAAERNHPPIGKVVISDLRFVSEAHWATVNGMTVEVRRSGFGPRGDHRSEHDLDDWVFDYVLHNDDIDTLRSQVNDLADFADRFRSRLRFHSRPHR